MENFKTLPNCGKCENQFITNVDNLCKECPVLKFVENNHKNRLKKFEVLKNSHTKESLKVTIKLKLISSTQKIEDMMNWEHTQNANNRNNKYRTNRIAVVLDYSSLIKFYSQELQILDDESKTDFIGKLNNENELDNNSSIKSISSIAEFIDDFIDGIKQLQQNDINEECIRNVREKKPDKETSFRYSFKKFFEARYKNQVVIAEPEKGKTRIDLKIIHKEYGEKIIEFKGWWNYEKEDVASQICNYLTDFEKDGYVFMINDSKEKDITNDYKAIITSLKSQYIQDTWKEYQYQNTDFRYFESKHKFYTKEKIIYHFIFNVYF